ncbi:c-type cytochrome [Fodinibius salsisoli]|uniref:Cytochrome c n=1 Tax=Fodinibius salsisoli TaxID=2820877 RepID=A0ABT3PNG4_9BACT|nr:cytochrome c [Fodinibius salsisoli]MCW9707319.1 cytochrome c [Fodinibius salsisoli]
MENTIKNIVGLLLVTMLILAGCGGGAEQGNTQSAQKASTSGGTEGLTAFEQKHGIGPVTEVITVDQIDMKKVKKGKELFKIKCSACHKIGERYIGPKLGDVFDDRTPTYVMNMILNPDGMVKEHPEAKKMLQEFLSPMPNQNLEREEARAIVEYLSSVQNDTAK